MGVGSVGMWVGVLGARVGLCVWCLCLCLCLSSVSGYLFLNFE